MFYQNFNIWLISPVKSSGTGSNMMGGVCVCVCVCGYAFNFTWGSRLTPVGKLAIWQPLCDY